ncbi:MerR family transcriptional regulator [Streptomyces sp. NBC_01498]|uniref:MerR family transcriptional regulator n=1 Tax=Streptomyces sp. NBC_01498 TaxID=2975870 RepID=UPI002E7B861F|nr:MerR family transcriptional regulator [Streptomyces sp. NBC_01498]WTL27145.1 MerR family transcriptional regulator [Streptomyces sp. NBC_01498]
MRIGEIAALVGVTPRAVRHYHHRGLLPEPVRRSNGYRVYSVRDAVLLARIRRLSELGLGLDEVRDVLADDAGRDLEEVLGELDADLARQEEDIRARRRRLAELREGALPPEGPVSPTLARLLRAMPETDSAMAAKDRELLTLLDTAGTGEAFYDALHPLVDDPEVLALYRRLDALADAAPDDPRIGRLAEELAALVPDAVLDSMSEPFEPSLEGVGEAILADIAPAQAEVGRRVMAALVRKHGQRTTKRDGEGAG